MYKFTQYMQILDSILRLIFSFFVTNCFFRFSSRTGGGYIYKFTQNMKILDSILRLIFSFFPDRRCAHCTLISDQFVTNHLSVGYGYGVATISRLLTIIGLFCRISSLP